MTVKLLYFASLRESLDNNGEELELPGEVNTVADLRDYLSRRGPAWEKLTNARLLRAAVNQKMVDEEAAVADGDEVAFFPPVTGG